jgi:hypothetical protein
MAVADWNNLTAISREKVLPGIVDQIKKSNKLLTKFFANVKMETGGTFIDVIVRYKHSTQGGSYAGLEPLSAAAETNKTRARFSWKQYEQPIVFSNIDIAKNGGEGKIEDLLKTEMEEARVDLTDKFANAIFAGYTSGITGNGGKDIDSIVGATDDGSNVATYGGIDRSANVWWKGVYTQSSSVGGHRYLSISDMRTMFSAVTDGEDRPDMIVTTDNGYDAYEALMTQTLQFITNNAAGTGDASFGKLAFRSVEVMADKYCPAGQMYFLNSKYLGFRVLKHPDFATTKEGFAMSDLQRPTNQDGKVGYIFWYGNLICSQPRRQGHLYNIENA